jgi:hypothetical protein
MAMGGLVKVKAGSGAWTDRREYSLVLSDEETFSPKCVHRGQRELSTISNGSTPCAWPGPLGDVTNACSPAALTLSADTSALLLPGVNPIRLDLTAVVVLIRVRGTR